MSETCPITVRIQPGPFDAAAESAKLSVGRTDIGAIVTFTGLCRAEQGRLAALELEHYPGMAEEELQRVAEDAARRWPLMGITAIHRYGRIPPGADIVLVVTASSHRAGGIRGRRVHHGLPEDPRAFLEEGARPGRF